MLNLYLSSFAFVFFKKIKKHIRSENETVLIILHLHYLFIFKTREQDITLVASTATI